MKLKNYKELLEGYTKKSAVANSKNISIDIYNILVKHKEDPDFQRKFSFDPMKRDLKPNMFKIQVDRRFKTNRMGNEARGRKARKMYDAIIIKWYDSFWNDFRDKPFFTAKEFNKFIQDMKKFK